jgi:predicted Zn-dependent protease with MMP-like domain
MLETLKPVLRAAAVAALSVGLLVLFLNPPSLSGASGLAVLAVGAAALTILSAWATVLLMGRDAPSEEEFERLVRRSEKLARSAPGPPDDGSHFDALVRDAIDRLPPEFQELLETTPVIVSNYGREYRAYGHYFGDTVSGGRFERRIVLYRDTLERDFGYDPDVLRRQVERTLRHELAHHLGWGERGVRTLGL